MTAPLPKSSEKEMASAETTNEGLAVDNTTESMDDESAQAFLDKWNVFASAFEIKQTGPVRISSLDSLKPKK